MGKRCCTIKKKVLVVAKTGGVKPPPPATAPPNDTEEERSDAEVKRLNDLSAVPFKTKDLPTTKSEIIATFAMACEFFRRYQPRGIRNTWPPVFMRCVNGDTRDKSPGNFRVVTARDAFKHFDSWVFDWEVVYIQTARAYIQTARAYIQTARAYIQTARAYIQVPLEAGIRDDLRKESAAEQNAVLDQYSRFVEAYAKQFAEFFAIPQGTIPTHSHVVRVISKCCDSDDDSDDEDGAKKTKKKKKKKAPTAVEVFMSDPAVRRHLATLAKAEAKERYATSLAELRSKYNDQIEHLQRVLDRACQAEYKRGLADGKKISKDELDDHLRAYFVKTRDEVRREERRRYDERMRTILNKEQNSSRVEIRRQGRVIHGLHQRVSALKAQIKARRLSTPTTPSPRTPPVSLPAPTPKKSSKKAASSRGKRDDAKAKAEAAKLRRDARVHCKRARELELVVAARDRTIKELREQLAAAETRVAAVAKREKAVETTEFRLLSARAMVAQLVD